MEDIDRRHIKICKAIGLWEIMGKKWSLEILKSLSDQKPRQFTQFKMLIPNISNKILSERLNMLEQENLVIKNREDKNTNGTQYRLSQLGIELDKILDNMDSWIEKWELSRKNKK